MTYFNPSFSLTCLDFFVGIFAALPSGQNGRWLASGSRFQKGYWRNCNRVIQSLCSIGHNLLLATLRAYGVGEEAIDFLHSYLSGRKQRVKVNVLMALVRRQLTSCIPTCLVESKEWKSTCLWRWWGGNWLLAFLLVWSKAKSESQRAYGVGEEAIDFLHSYLSGRKQRVKVNGVFSDWVLVYCGVRQEKLKEICG